MEALLAVSLPDPNRNVRQVDKLPAARGRRAPAARQDEAGNRSLQRGLSVLDAVQAGGPDGVRVVDLCHATGLERATVYRLLATLIECGYVATGERFRYLPGPRAGSRAGDGQPNLAVRLQPVLARVSDAFGDATFAIVREGGQSHCIARHVGTHPVQVLVIQVGTRQPLGVGAAGLALLAALPDGQVQSIIHANAPSLPAYGGMTTDRLKLLVSATRQRGYSVIGNHATRDVLAVGMAVRDVRGHPAAALSLASTVARMPPARQRLVACEMRRALQELLPGGLKV